MTRNRRRFPLRRLADGRALLNLGSSARVAPGWNNVDSGWLFRIGRHRRMSSFLHGIGLISEARYERLSKLDSNAVFWNLARGIPFPDETFDVVYHCHLLEHLEREAAPTFLRECHRVLLPGGVVRVVLPDLEQLARAYLSVVDRLPEGATAQHHSAAVDELFDQMVRRIPKGRKEQKPHVRLLEALLIGDTSRAGERHRWMYDRFSLKNLLRSAGFTDVRTQDERRSQIAGWESFYLDTEPDGKPYKPGSLYMEARRPASPDPILC